MKQVILPLETYDDRLEDYRRHLVDLRDRTYEGCVSRADREAIFKRAVELLSPVVEQVLDEFNKVMFANTGLVEWRPVQSDGDGGLISLWVLSWPLQREARRRTGGYWDENSEPMQPSFLKETPPGAIDPIVIQTFLVKEGKVGWLHGHIAGRFHTPNSMWPLNVVTEDDACRQAIVIWMIAEGELHRVVYEMSHAPMSILPAVVDG
jgi:hypothetical protein